MNVFSRMRALICSRQIVSVGERDMTIESDFSGIPTGKID